MRRLTDPRMVPFVRVCRVAEAEVPAGYMTQPQQLRDFWNLQIAGGKDHDPDKECLYVFMLNSKLVLRGVSLVSMGTLNESMAHPREIFRPAIAMAAYAIALMHNHPSGDPSPSDADRSMTRTIQQGGELLRIRLIDHVIYGHPEHDQPARHFSFRESGLLA